MNINHKRVPTRFDPESRFELRPTPAVPFRALQETELERLKNRLLVTQLERTAEPELNAPLRHAANEAAALAWVTFYPLLVFPELFEEKTRAAIRHARRQASILTNHRDLVVL